MVPGNVTYAAAKRFIVTLTEGASHGAHGHRGIQVQAVCPGFVDTDFHENNVECMWIRRERVCLDSVSLGEVVDEAMKEFEKGSIVWYLIKAGKLVRRPWRSICPKKDAVPVCR